MMKSQRDEIKGYSLAGGKSAVPSRAPPKPAAQPRAAAPVSGVKVTQIRRGDGINYPQPGDVCTVHYVGKLRATKQVFDSSIKRGPPFTFQVGTGQVIRGWDEGVLQMSLGEKSQLVISPEYGYGATGQGPIPPNAELVFDVDLLAINGQKAGGRFAGGN
ncbi:FKBP-type peptidyl-prolyl cis-trans isomerase [Guillardia theta CCMP2712]|uniref:peptidylprolyl isomerase n=1 Tax=Guillardia theta (strain CCMP2712) TaxID=905079 RepID=L1JGG9_GUITC|nr:FKBP-type peptidyl-prolyl cis-trans isomerase [Guillardia theta CCMP2712]EKX47190.1 FKBP-type peptidyl-prolyl cis-trans isomerase [Guillardia theta CCMP2712]|eukprot:XP_005834170.1 FKBP-type peptidyl-prolyl cis-trans isomerase [Guillardia theta CCMP2712]